jgi:hypothetical protein
MLSLSLQSLSRKKEKEGMKGYGGAGLDQGGREGRREVGRIGWGGERKEGTEMGDRPENKREAQG